MIASISPAKMVLFKISREEQSRIYKGDEDCASPMWQGKGTTFIEVSGFSFAESLPGKRSSLSSSCWTLSVYDHSPF